LARRHAADDLRAVLLAAQRVERALAAGEALDEHARVPIDENAHAGSAVMGRGWALECVMVRVLPRLARIARALAARNQRLYARPVTALAEATDDVAPQRGQVRSSGPSVGWRSWMPGRARLRSARLAMAGRGDAGIGRFESREKRQLRHPG